METITEKSFDHILKTEHINGCDLQRLVVERLKENSDSLIKEYDIVIKSNGRLFNYDKEDFKYDFQYKKALKKAKLYSLKEQGRLKNTKYEVLPCI